MRSRRSCECVDRSFVRLLRQSLSALLGLVRIFPASIFNHLDSEADYNDSIPAAEVEARKGQSFLLKIPSKAL